MRGVGDGRGVLFSIGCMEWSAEWSVEWSADWSVEWSLEWSVEWGDKFEVQTEAGILLF